MKDPGDPYSGAGLPSITGTLVPVLIPKGIGYDDPRKVGKALLRDRFDLSREEVRTLLLLVMGLSYERIKHTLGINIDTVKNRVKSIFEKMGVHDRNQAAAKASVFILGTVLTELETDNDECS